MALTALLVCADPEAVPVLRQLLMDRRIGVECCDGSEVAVSRLAQQRFSVLLLDCQDQPAAVSLIAAARTSPLNANALIVAIVDASNETRELFAHGANFLLYKPVSIERAAESLQAAWSLMPQDRRRKPRVHVSTLASVTFGTIEDAKAPLLNLSDRGVALHSQSKMPPPCRVYFQFTLPGQSSVVRLSGEVVWQDWRGRAGVHFAHVPQASQRALNEWLHNNAAREQEKIDPEPLVVERLGEHIESAGSEVIAPLSPAEAERRQQARRACRLSADVVRVGGGAMQRCTLTDVSVGGCYLETTQPFPIGTTVVMEIRTQDVKLCVRGAVKSEHRGYGMGVEFSLKTPVEREQVKRLIACQDAQLLPAASMPAEQM